MDANKSGITATSAKAAHADCDAQRGCQYLGFHLVTIYRLLKKQEIPATKIGGQWRFKKDVLDAWLMSRMNK
jgi:excisionase family DNA binding protein